MDATQRTWQARAMYLDRLWRVTVDGLPTPSGFTVQRLHQVPTEARRMIYGYTGLRPADGDITVDVMVPAWTEDRLRVARSLSADAAVEFDAAARELVDAGWQQDDIDYFLGADRDAVVTAAGVELEEAQREGGSAEIYDPSSGRSPL